MTECLCRIILTDNLCLVRFVLAELLQNQAFQFLPPINISGITQHSPVSVVYTLTTVSHVFPSHHYVSCKCEIIAFSSLDNGHLAFTHRAGQEFLTLYLTNKGPSHPHIINYSFLELEKTIELFH